MSQEQINPMEWLNRPEIMELIAYAMESFEDDKENKVVRLDLRMIETYRDLVFDPRYELRIALPKSVRIEEKEVELEDGSKEKIWVLVVPPRS